MQILVSSCSQTLGKSSSLFLYDCLYTRYLTSEVQFFLFIIGGFHCSYFIWWRKVHLGKTQVLLQIYLQQWVRHLTHSTCWVSILFWLPPFPILTDQLPLGVSIISKMPQGINGENMHSHNLKIPSPSCFPPLSLSIVSFSETTAYPHSRFNPCLTLS